MSLDWTEGSIVGFPTGGPASHMISPIFINTATGSGMTQYPDSGLPGSDGPWRKVDLSAVVPEGTKAVFLSGLLIITHGTNPGTADLAVGFRKTGFQLTPNPTGDPDNHAYVLQVCDAFPGGGQRSSAAVWVALDENRCFEFRWQRTLPGAWPSNPAYGINLRVTSYIKAT